MPTQDTSWQDIIIDKLAHDHLFCGQMLTNVRIASNIMLKRTIEWEHNGCPTVDMEYWDDIANTATKQLTNLNTQTRNQWAAILPNKPARQWRKSQGGDIKYHDTTSLANISASMMNDLVYISYQELKSNLNHLTVQLAINQPYGPISATTYIENIKNLEQQLIIILKHARNNNKERTE